MSYPRRRPRSEIEADEDDDDIRSSQRSTPSSSYTRKRARRNDHQSDSELESPQPEGPRTNYSQEHNDIYNSDNDSEQASNAHHEQSEFQAGSIRRVKVTNFVTYEKAEFFPGPNLNMVIGPNGTGKSSLVCAICLGLGWGPQHLGRAGQVGEFVKHGMSEAEVEIELERRPDEPNNFVVRVRIIRDGNQREWYLGGKKTTLKAVQDLTRSLSIQIDNLCQFLPQDKVSEFAALSPVDLLLQTQRAAAPEEMLTQHEQLKKRRKEQKSLEEKHAADQEALESMENRQQNLQAEVRRLQERQDIQQRVMILKKKIPFIEYQAARTEHLVYKTRKIEAQARLARLKERVEPILATVYRKEAVRDQLVTAVRQSEQILKDAEQEAKVFVDKLEATDEKIKDKEGACQIEIGLDNTRKVALRKIQQQITVLEAKLKEPPVEFDASVWNNRIANLNQEAREIDIRTRESRAKYAEMNQAAKLKQKELADTKEELIQFQSAEGQRISKLDKLSRDTADAWKWIQAHQDEFEKEVYGPPLVSCSIKDPRYLDAIESLFQKNDMLAFTAQTSADWRKLRQRLITEKKLGDITLKTCTAPLSEIRKPPLSEDDMRRYGFDSWALDLIDGPEPVLAMLCGSIKLHNTAIGLRETTESQYSSIMASGVITSWVSGRHNNRILRRAEYGASASTIVTKPVNSAKEWSDSPIDVTKRDEIQSRIDALSSYILQMGEEVDPVRADIEKAKAAILLKREEETRAKDEKATLQRAYAAQKAIPDKITTEKENEAAKKREASQIQQRLNTIYTEHDNLVLQKTQLALNHKDVVAKLRLCHEELLEVKIRLIETKSDIQSLNERNGDIRDQVAREEELVQTADAESKRVKSIASRALAACKEIQAEPDFESIMEEVARDEPGVTVELVDQEIAAEESKLEFIHANNPNAIRDFEARQKDLEKLTEKMTATTTRLKQLELVINRIRSQWEPELDELIAKISEAFAFNFEQIGCAGEVSVHKDDDFEQWAIQIKVRFRENETLQLLDQHRQSGGERSVSTIFYLMSLQSMARAPFRVVDEINQGMDPRNERMVHERMVEIACKEHTSQYFLITPKLLTGLRYDKRMKVLCIASGEHMPENYKNLDISRIIGIQRAVIASA